MKHILAAITSLFFLSNAPAFAGDNDHLVDHHHRSPVSKILRTAQPYLQAAHKVIFYTGLVTKACEDTLPSYLHFHKLYLTLGVMGAIDLQIDIMRRKEGDTDVPPIGLKQVQYVEKLLTGFYINDTSFS